MRILLSCLQDLRPHPIPAYRFWTKYFKNGIVEAGHEWTEVADVDWAEGCSVQVNQLRAWRDRTWGRTIAFVRRELAAGRAIDFFLSYFSPQQVEPAAIVEIQKLGVPCVNFFCDNVREFTRVPTEFHYFDLHWVPEFEGLPMYDRAGLKTCFAPMPCWVAPEYRIPESNESDAASFIGSHDRLREDLLGRAIRAGAHVTIRGPGWLNGSTGDHHSTRCGSRVANQLRFVRENGFTQWLNKIFGRSLPRVPATVPRHYLAAPVWGYDYARVTRESIVTVGINRVPTFRRSWQNPLKYSRLRDIEAPMMGACYLTEWTAGLEHLYDVGVEVETYRTAEELAQKIDDLKRDPARRRQMRQRGQRRALNDHSVAKTLTRILDRLGVRPQ